MARRGFSAREVLSRFGVILVLLGVTPALSLAADQWITFAGQHGQGAGKHIVLISGDEEYRSEEGLPQLAKILSRHHGFTCTVLFAINPETGLIDPNYTHNVPGLQSLGSADLMILQTRFRDLPDEQMKYFVDYLNAGKPIVGLRTATHAFAIPAGQKYSKYSWDNHSGAWKGGFGRQVLGETWVSHWGHHGQQSTRGVIAPGQERNPIVRGCTDIWGPTDVYEVHLGPQCTPLVLGQVLSGMHPDDPPISGPKNNPMMPIAWTKTYEGEQGRSGRVFVTTMGAATDLQSEGLRRLIVNAAYWCLGMEKQIPAKADVDIVGEFHPTDFGFNHYRKGLGPSDYAAR